MQIIKSYEVRNSTKQLKFRKIHSLLRFLPQPVDRLYKQIKKSLGIKELGLYDKFKKVTLTTNKRKPLSDADRNKLVDEFQSEINLVEEILERDLSHWTK